jgi:hypothetical protein
VAPGYVAPGYAPGYVAPGYVDPGYAPGYVAPGYATTSPGYVITTPPAVTTTAGLARPNCSVVHDWNGRYTSVCGA